MRLKEVLYEQYKKDNLQEVLRLLESYAVDQKDQDLLTVVHTQQARLANWEKRFKTEGIHPELNTERNQLRSAIAENFESVGDETAPMNYRPSTPAGPSYTAPAVAKPLLWSWSALFFGVALIIGGLFYINGVFKPTPKPGPNVKPVPVVPIDTPGTVTEATNKPPKINKTTDNPPPTVIKPSPAPKKIALRVQADSEDRASRLTADLQGWLRNQKITTVAFQDKDNYAQVIDAVLTVEEKAMKIGMREDAINYTLRLSIKVLNAQKETCYTEVFRSKPLVGYANADNSAVLDKALADVLRQCRENNIPTCY
jgi:hypothetical protein